MAARGGFGVVMLALVGLAGCGVPAEAQEAGKEVRAQEEEELAAVASPVTPAALTGGADWVRHPESSGYTVASSVVQDRDGSVLVLANVEGSVDFGRGSLSSTAQARWLIVLAKYAPDGRLLWAKGFPAAGSREGPATALAVDRQRNVLIAGRSEGPVDFGGGVRAAGTFLVKLDRTGRHLWSRTVAGEKVGMDVYQLVTDPNGGIGLSAGLSGSFTLDGRTVTSSGQPTLLKLGQDGRLLWRYVDLVPGEFTGLVPDSAGNFYACGLTNTNVQTGFVWKLSASGQRLWAKNLGELAGGPQSIAVHGSRVVVVGSFALPFTWGGKTLTPDRQRAFAAALTTDGQERWLRTFGVAGTSVVMDQNDGVVVLGSYLAGDDVGSGPLPGNPSTNVFVTKLDRLEGRTRWVRAYDQAFQPVELSTWRERGDAVLLGSFFAPLTLEGQTLTPGATPDFFLLKLRP
ncbi:MAG TPA: hypothetical protein VK447_03990 [Myxococcaceae bacterium]|nr:hypothetical protein [Myxococcaceae bacterium]